VTAEQLSDGTKISCALNERFLATLPARLIEVDPVKVFAHLNTLLTIGAIGCVSLVWDSEVSAEVELSRIAFLDYFNAAGFSVERYFTGQNDIDMGLNSFARTYKQEWCFELKKRADLINLTPQPYYSGKCSTLKNSAIKFVRDASHG
jgi:hypothetical protein